MNDKNNEKEIRSPRETTKGNMNGIFIHTIHT